ncbi:MAG TPA: RNA methyltransferase [Chitinophagaceae bacterium]
MQVPEQLIKSLQTVPGFDEAAFRSVHETGRQVTSIRLNPEKISDPGTLIFNSESGDKPPSVSRVPWCKHGYYLSHRPKFTLDPLLHAGAYYVQEASSMFLWHVLDSAAAGFTNPKVLDLCAAPGGKSTLLSSFFRKGMVVSNEVIKSRVNILQENVTKWGDGNVVITNNDSKDFSALKGFFDVIVTDVPCSGSGLFRRDPEAVQEWSPGNVHLCCQRQQRILADIIPSLKQGGLLIYSTCSYSVEEDEDILDFIIDGFQLSPVDIPVPEEWNIARSRSAKHGATGFRFFPNRVEGEGFFIAVFRQENMVSQARLPEAAMSFANTKESALVNAFIHLPEGSEIFKHAETLRLFPAMFVNPLRQLMKQLYIRQAGIALGSPKGDTLIPDHALAVSAIDGMFPEQEVSTEQAVAYLRKQDMHFTGPQGWCRITYRRCGLGWVKNLTNRTNNYYPSNWRILKT